MARVNINDVADADQQVQEVLDEMKKVVDDDAYYSTKAICAAIQAVGIRLDYVITTKLVAL